MNEEHRPCRRVFATPAAEASVGVLISSRGLVRALFVALGCFVVAGATPAPSPAQNQKTPPRERYAGSVDVDLVLIDVVALDSRGEPVRGLSRSAFRLTELQGKKKRSPEITIFEEVEQTAAPAPLVIFVDELFTPFATRAQTIRLLVTQLEQVLAERPRPVSVVRLDGTIHIEQPFLDSPRLTIDTLTTLAENSRNEPPLAALELAALETVGTMMGQARGSAGDRRMAMASMSGVLQQLSSFQRTVHQQVELALGMMLAYVRTLSSEPGRKEMLLVSEGIPLRPFEAARERLLDLSSGASARGGDAVEDSGLGRTGLGTRGIGDGGLAQRDFDMDIARGQSEGSRLDSDGTLELVIAEANNYRVTIHTLKPVASSESSTSASDRGRIADLELSEKNESLQRLARDTGGQVSFTQNERQEFFSSLGSGRTHSYTLGFAPQKLTEGELVGVRVQVKGVPRVAHRASYRYRDRDGRLIEQTWAAQTIAAPTNSLGMTLQLLDVQNAAPIPSANREQGATANDRRTVRLALEFPIARIGLLDFAGQGILTTNVSAVVVAADLEGRPLAENRLQIPLQVPQADLETARASFFRAIVEIALPPGAHRVAMGVLDHLHQKTSFTTLDLEIR